MSDAADRRIAELEAEVRRLMRQNGVEREISASMDAAAQGLTDAPVAPPDDEDVP